MAITAIVGAITTAVQAGQQIFGGEKFVRCPGQPGDTEVQHMLTYVSPATLLELETAYAQSHNGAALPAHDPAALAFAAYGGTDCKITGSTGAAYRAVFDRAMAETRTTYRDVGAGYVPYDSYQTSAQAAENASRTAVVPRAQGGFSITAIGLIAVVVVVVLVFVFRKAR